MIAALLTVAVCIGWGKLFLRLLGLRFSRAEHHLFAFLTGSAALSLLVFAFCAAGWARPGVLLALGLAALPWLALPSAGKRHTWSPLVLLSLAPFFLYYLVNAAAPEVSPDGSSYHLGLVARYLREGGFRSITTNMYANLSQGAEMLFLFAFAFGRHSAAALVHLSFLVALAAAMLLYAGRFGLSPWAALLVFACPVVGVDASSAYIDVALTAVAFGLFYLLEIWDAERHPRLLIPIGLLAGFAYAIKYTGVLAVPYAMWRVRRGAPTVALAAALMMLPWMAKNWIWLGNPVSPFANALFPNPYVTVGFERQYREYLRHYELKSGWEIPLAATVRGPVSGLLGPVFLLAPLALAGPPRLLLAAVIFGLPFLGNVSPRFLIPALPFLALGMTARLRRFAPAVGIAHALLSLPPVVPMYSEPWAWRVAHFPWREALRLRPEEEYLRGRVADYGLARKINETVPPGERVFSFSALPEAYIERDVLVMYQAAFNQTLGRILWTPILSDTAPTWHLRFRFAPRSLRRIRVLQTARGAPDHWSVGELRVLRGGQELPRAAGWRLRAHPYPWGVQMAFDNSPVTRWSSEQTLFPGMFVEVDFGRAEMADEVLLEASHDQYKIRLRLEGEDEAGRRQTLATAPEESDATPLLGLRRAATRELNLRGVKYFVVQDRDFWAQDFRERAALWGIEQVAESGGARLYRIL